MAEALGGRDNDGIAEVWITQPDIYYALVRSDGTSSGLLDQYLLDVLILPAEEVSIPNLQVVQVEPPSGTNFPSGQPITCSWAVANVRSNATGVSY